MKKTEENISFCQRQIDRIEGTNFFASLSDVSIKELVDALLLSADSQAAAEMMVSSRLLLSDQRPTPADFAKMAMDAKREQQAQQSWQPPSQNSHVCPRCFGTGMEIVFSLHTREGQGEFAYTRKEPITREVFDSFNGGKLDPITQGVYSGAKPCKCSVRMQ